MMRIFRSVRLYGQNILNHWFGKGYKKTGFKNAYTSRKMKDLFVKVCSAVVAYLFKQSYFFSFMNDK